MATLGVALQVPAPASTLEAAHATELRAHHARPDAIPFPETNPCSLVKTLLGTMLFFDARLSRAGIVRCASWQEPLLDWEAPVTRLVGDARKRLGRNGSSTLDHARAQRPFRNRRAKELEEQAGGQIRADVEMNTSMEALIERIAGVSE